MHGDAPLSSRALSEGRAAKGGVTRGVAVVTFAPLSDGSYQTRVEHLYAGSQWVHPRVISHNVELWVLGGARATIASDAGMSASASGTTTFLTGLSDVRIVACSRSSSAVAANLSPVDELAEAQLAFTSADHDECRAWSVHDGDAFAWNVRHLTPRCPNEGVYCRMHNV